MTQILVDLRENEQKNGKNQGIFRNKLSKKVVLPQRRGRFRKNGTGNAAENAGGCDGDDPGTDRKTGIIG